MITQKHREALLIAREATGYLEDCKWLPVLKLYAEVDRAEDLDRRGYERMMDFFVYEGLRDPRYVSIVEPDYHRVVRRWAELAPLDPDELQAIILAADADDIALMDAHAFRRVFRYFSFRGIARADHLARGVMTRKQLALLHVAQRDIKLEDSTFKYLLLDVGGVLRPQDLSQRGFDRVLFYVTELGFVPPSRTPKPAKRPSYGRRPGMASPAQVQLVRELWREWSGADDQDALHAWLEKYHHVSNLRFLSAATAGHVLTALKAMKARRRASPDTAA